MTYTAFYMLKANSKLLTSSNYKYTNKNVYSAGFGSRNRNRDTPASSMPAGSQTHLWHLNFPTHFSHISGASVYD